MRKTDLVISDIKELVSTKGYIYALCLILFEDFHINLETIHQTNHREKLSVKEATLLVGFLVQNEIDFSLPLSPESVIGLKDQTYVLMKELQSSYNIPQIEKLQQRLLKMQEGLSIENDYDERFDFFVNDGGMVEPMFYAGDGVYDFQYLEYLEKKYRYDKEWLSENKNFDINHSIKIVNEIKDILQTKSSNVNLIGLRDLAPIVNEKARKKFKNRYTDKEFDRMEKEALISVEFYQYFNLFPFPPQNSTPESVHENWKVFYENLIDLFVVERSQLDANKKTDSFLDNFSFSPSLGVNKEYIGAGYFNILNSKPLVKLDQNRFFIPINYLVAEAVYESPFYWMCEDKNYQTSLSHNRGQVGEEIVYESLSQVFGKDNTYKSVIITTKKGHRDTDIDVLCILGNKALCVQVKSKKLTLPAKRGDTDQLVKDFKGAVQDAYNQGLVSRNKILENKAKFYNEFGEEIIFPNIITDIYIMGITTENYPSLTHQSFIMLEKEDNDPYPIFLSIFDLELLVHYLKDPYDFLYYVRQRISLMDYYRADEEMVYLGYHLQKKLWPYEEADGVAIDTDFGYIIDRNYYPLKAGYDHLVSETNDPIKNLWKDEAFDKLCAEIKRMEEPMSTDIIFHLLDWSGDGRKDLVDNVLKIKRTTLADKEMHTMSTSTPPEFGISYISLDTNNINDLRDRLLKYSMARKYRSKCDAWLGIGSLLSSPYMLDYIVYSDETWEYDQELELLANQLLDSNKNRKVISLIGKKKIGRNDPCPCGSGLKYKKCCGKNIG